MEKQMNTKLEFLMPIIKKQLDEGKSVKFKPHGTSMLPMLRQGIDSIVLSPLPEKLNKYDLPLYQRANGQYVLHRIVDVGDTYTCIGDNQYVLEKGLTHNQMIAVVTEFYRGDKCYSCKKLSYKMYCVFWHKSRKLRHFIKRAVGWLRRHLKHLHRS